jgi:cytoskeletal protein CcmA (bactofilin family)
MAKYKDTKKDFAQAVSQLTPSELKEDIMKEEKKNRIITDMATEEFTNNEESVVAEFEDVSMVFPDKDINENHDMSELIAASDVNETEIDSSEKESENKEEKKKTGRKKAEEKIETVKEPDVDSDLSEVRDMNALEQEIRSSDELRGIGEDTTYITKGTAINGNIESDGDIEILGRVDGNVRCGGKLIVGGRVTGDIETGELYAEVANISGEIRATGTVKIGSGSVTVGNIFAETAVIAGAVKGDIDIRDSVVIDSTAVIVGNIKSKSVQVNSGAIIDGFCKQEYSEVDVEKYFKSGIESLS